MLLFVQCSSAPKPLPPYHFVRHPALALVGMPALDMPCSLCCFRALPSHRRFVLATVWAFGGGLAPKDGIEYRRNFDKWWKQKWTAVKFPSKGSIYDYYINSKTGKFSAWSDLVTDVEFDSLSQDMTSVFVPTSETSAFMYFLDLMIELRKPLMFVGLSGTGKTQLIKGKLAALGEGMMSLPVAFNYFTDVISFQKILESQLEKKAGINYGPPGLNKCAPAPRPGSGFQESPWKASS